MDVDARLRDCLCAFAHIRLADHVGREPSSNSSKVHRAYDHYIRDVSDYEREISARLERVKLYGLWRYVFSWVLGSSN